MSKKIKTIRVSGINVGVFFGGMKQNNNPQLKEL